MAEALDRDELRDVIRGVLDREASPERLRAALDQPLGHDAALWSSMGELGWTGLAIPEEYGGAGASLFELAVVLEELGRYLVPSPFTSTSVLAAAALLLGGSEDQRRKFLPRIAAGEMQATAALTGAGGGWELEASGLALREAGGGFEVDGVADFVPDARGAELAVLAARAPGGEIGLLLADPRDPAVGIEPRQTWDPTRRLWRLEIRGLALPRESLLGELSAGAGLRERLLDLASVALACDSVGGAARVLETTVEYARQRIQFDRPIGSFQAVKHRCADMLTLVEASRVGAAHAAEAVARGAGNAPLAASEAKFTACDAYAKVAGDGVQLHGGVGYTWEYDCHFFLKRAKLNQVLFGDSTWHRDRAAALLLDSGGPGGPAGLD